MVKSRFSDVHLPYGTSLPEYVLKEASKHGNNPAIIDGDTGEQYSFAELVEAIQRFASALCREGVGKGDIVCLLSQNSIHYPVVFHGSIAAGATLVTAAASLTPGELARQLVDCRAKYLISSSELLASATAALKKQQTQVRKTYVIGQAPGYRTLKDLLKDDGQAFPNIKFNPKEDIAVVSYSSGTTGIPKGVMLSHFAMLSNMCQFRHPDVQMSKGTTIAFLPFYHSFGITALLNFGIVEGDTMVSMAKFDFMKYLELIEKYKASMLYMVPPVGLLLAKSPATARFNLTSMEQILISAAPVSAELTEELIKKFPHLSRIMQAYGMTEAGPGTHVGLHSKPYGSCGKLLPQTECKIMDLDGVKEMGVGQAGELWVRGPQLMVGYLNRPKATAETIDPQGWLHTGDVGYYDEDENFFIVDRIKELIKYKGLQVAPAELEALILTHPAVADVGVIGLPDTDAGELPIAFVVKKPGASVLGEDIKKFVAGQVSNHKRLRGGLKFVKEIPKSPTGKILRRILREQMTPQGKSKL